MAATNQLANKVAPVATKRLLNLKAKAAILLLADLLWSQV